MSGALVRRLDGWAIIPLFFVACAILVGCPIVVMPNRVGVSIGVFLALVIAGSLHEIHRRDRLGAHLADRRAVAVEYRSEMCNSARAPAEFTSATHDRSQVA